MDDFSLLFLRKKNKCILLNNLIKYNKVTKNSPTNVDTKIRFGKIGSSKKKALIKNNNSVRRDFQYLCLGLTW